MKGNWLTTKVICVLNSKMDVPLGRVVFQVKIELGIRSKRLITLGALEAFLLVDLFEVKS